METSVTATSNDFELVASKQGQHVSSRKAQDELKQLTQRFRDALKRSVAGIIEAGKVVIEAKEKLPHGQFTEWVDKELRFGDPTTARSREGNIRKAQMLKMLAEHEVISNPNHWHALPTSIRTLCELTPGRQ
jgi:Protein of unknown function (DUF3102)